MGNLLLVWLAALTSAISQPRCSMGVSFHGPTEERAIVLAVATSESVQVPLPDRALLSIRTPEALHVVPAYRFRVAEVAGGGERHRSMRTLLAAPWKYDSACDLLPWGPAQWVAPGEEAVFTLAERRTDVAGEPVYDVLGWHAPYPQGEFLKYESDEARMDDREAWLGARDLFALLRALPDDAGESAAERLVRMERVFAEGDPRWRDSFPGTEILRRARAAAERAPGSMP
jgi:hypothetical protein